METLNQAGTVFFTDAVATITTDRVREALGQSNLDPELARDLAKRFCFSRAKNRLDIEGLMDEVVETPEKWVFQLSKRYREEQQLSYEYNGQFWFDKKTQTVGADTSDLLEKVNVLFAKYGALYLPSDVSKLVRRVFDRQRGMISLRHHGVVYFVPVDNIEVMNKVATFIQMIGGKCLSVPVGRENKAVVDQVQENLVERTNKELATILAELKALKEKGEGFSSRIANNRWRELVKQLDRLKLFAKSLNVDSASLVKQVRSAEFDLALVSGDSLDIVATLAHAGKISNTIGDIAKTAFRGELPPLDSPRVKRFVECLPDVSKIEMPVLKNGAKRSEVLATL